MDPNYRNGQYGAYTTEPAQPPGTWDFWPRHPGVNLCIGIILGMILMAILKKAGC